MNISNDFPDFVIYIPERKHDSFNKTADLIIGTLSGVCMLIGITGNISSTIYFWRRRAGSLPNLLYTVVSVVDICICGLALPVSISLFNDRRPVLFSSYIVCGVWTFLFNLLQRLSMFLVLLVSSTRAIAILFPFYHLKKTVVFTTCVCFGVFLIELDSVYLGFGVLSFIFWSPAGCCGVGPKYFPPGITWTVYIMLLLVMVFAISIAVFVSFVASTVALSKRKKPQNEAFFSLVTSTVAVKRKTILSKVDKKSREVSVTIALFSAVFLICNLPLFIQQLLSNCIAWFGLDNFLDDNTFIFWYGWLLSQFFFTVLNATLNPVLYHLRFKMFRQWVSLRYKESKSDMGKKLTDIKTTTRRYSMRFSPGEHPLGRMRGSRNQSIDLGAIRANYVPVQQRTKRKYAARRSETTIITGPGGSAKSGSLTCHEIQNESVLSISEVQNSKRILEISSPNSGSLQGDTAL